MLCWLGSWFIVNTIIIDRFSRSGVFCKYWCFCFVVVSRDWSIKKNQLLNSFYLMRKFKDKFLLEFLFKMLLNFICHLHSEVKDFCFQLLKFRINIAFQMTHTKSQELGPLCSHHNAVYLLIVVAVDIPHVWRSLFIIDLGISDCGKVECLFTSSIMISIVVTIGTLTYKLFVSVLLISIN